MIRMNLAGTGASSTSRRTHPTHGLLLPKLTPSAASPSTSSSSSSAAVAAAIFLWNNGGKETGKAKKAATPTKKKLTCYCSPPPRALRCPLHQFGSWPFRMLAAKPSSHSPTAAGSGDKPLMKKKGVVLPVVAGGNSLAFEGFLRRKRQIKKPSRFFFEHQTRVALEASDAPL